MQLTQFEQNYYDKGREDGIRQGMADGIRQGKAEGIRQGKADGIKENLIDLTKKSYKNGASPEQISILFEIPIEEVSDILKN